MVSLMEIVRHNVHDDNITTVPSNKAVSSEPCFDLILLDSSDAKLHARHVNYHTKPPVTRASPSRQPLTFRPHRNCPERIHRPERPQFSRPTLSRLLLEGPITQHRLPPSPNSAKETRSRSRSPPSAFRHPPSHLPRTCAPLPEENFHPSPRMVSRYPRTSKARHRSPREPVAWKTTAKCSVVLA